MKITVSIDSHSIELDADSVERLVSNLRDAEEYKVLYRALADHPASGVRSEVAYKDHLDAETVNKLANDPVPEVRRNLLRSNSGRAVLTEAQLQLLAEGDVDCAEIIADSLGRYQLESDALALMLAEHTDPKVRRSLARCSDVPKRLLKQMLKDADSAVRHNAKDTLE